MAAADKVESAVLDHLNVTNHSRIADGIAPAGVILMGVYAVEPDMFAIQEKALIGCPFAPAKAHARLNGVDQRVCTVDLGNDRIKVGIVHAPQMGLGNSSIRVIKDGALSSFNRFGAGRKLNDGLAVGVQQCMAYTNLGSRFVLVFYLRLHAQIGRRSGYVWRLYKRTVPGDMNRVFINQLYIAVNTAGEIMVASTRSKLRIPGVVNFAARTFVPSCRYSLKSNSKPV